MAGGGGAGAGLSAGGSGSGGGGGGGGREGDWDCGGCGNRNYAFRSLCNRCKQPRLLVDPNTPRDSKWLPRAGDWICTGNTSLATPRLFFFFCLLCFCPGLRCGFRFRVSQLPPSSISTWNVK